MTRNSGEEIGECVARVAARQGLEAKIEFGPNDRCPPRERDTGVDSSALVNLSRVSKGGMQAPSYLACQLLARR